MAEERAAARQHRKPRYGRAATLAAASVAAAATALAFPGIALEAAAFSLSGLVAVAPAVAAGLLLTAAVAASGASGLIARGFRGRQWRMILVAALAGAVTPVCGISVLPLVAALLAGGVPLAPVMAFWLSSPVTDPAMMAVTAATLGTAFAAGKTLAAFAIGLAGGAVTAALTGAGRLRAPLRPGWQRAAGGTACAAPGGPATSGGPAHAASGGLEWRFWRAGERRRIFFATMLATGRLMLAWLGIAFIAEYLLRRFLPQDWVAAVAGGDSAAAVPLAALVGAPLYLDGYAALPLVRGLMDAGMPPGAAMALLVAGGITSAWAAIPVYALVRLPLFLLYVALALAGAMLAGWAAQLALG